MVFITEQQLDDAASAIQDDETINESLVTELSEIQPAVFAFLFTENTELFTEYEKEYLLFILLTLWQAIRTQIDVEDMDNERLTPEQESTLELLHNEFLRCVHEAQAKRNELLHLIYANQPDSYWYNHGNCVNEGNNM